VGSSYLLEDRLLPAVDPAPDRTYPGCPLGRATTLT